MSPRTPLSIGVSSTSADPAVRPRGRTHEAATRVALTMMASVLIAGCDSRENITVPPEGESIDLSVDAMPSQDVVTATTLGDPIKGLTPDELARFDAGLDEFQELETVEEGLGPVFNEAGCVTCHNSPVGGTNGRAETRFGKRDRGNFDDLDHLGGSLLQDQGIGFVRSGRRKFTYVPEVVPRTANVTALRITTSLFGLGLVDAVPDQTFLSLARRQARNSPSTAGKANIVKEIRTGRMRVGRFGWKAQVPTLFQFSGDAYLNEMGITNPEFPIENAPQGKKDDLALNPFPGLNDEGEGVVAFADFMTFLGPPPRGERTNQTDAGGKVFSELGCANCHTPTLTTGRSPVAALSNKTFQPFSDFLLHDMGSLGDAIEQGQSQGREMRTAPLWGLKSRPVFLHDGRAKTPEEAILAHDGQGRNAAFRFSRLDSRERRALLAFLNSL